MFSLWNHLAVASKTMFIRYFCVATLRSCVSHPPPSPPAPHHQTHCLYVQLSTSSVWLSALPHTHTTRNRKFSRNRVGIGSGLELMPTWHWFRRWNQFHGIDAKFLKSLKIRPLVTQGPVGQSWALALYFQVRSPLSAHFISMDCYRSSAHLANIHVRSSLYRSKKNQWFALGKER